MTLLRHLERLDDRTLRAGLIGSVLVVLAASVTYLLVPQFKALRVALETRATLSEAVEKGKSLDSELTALRREVEQYRLKVQGDSANRPLKQMEAHIIGRLQRISWRHAVELRGVTPGAGRTVQMFREILFDVELSGDYASLVGWLGDLGNELGFVVVKEYEMRPLGRTDEDDPLLLLKLNMVSYRTVRS